jgi:putative aldouronate transport system substrate-binding protein
MKSKVLLISLAVILVISMAACGGNNSGGATTAAAATTAAVTTTAAATEAATTTAATTAAETTTAAATTVKAAGNASGEGVMQPRSAYPEKITVTSGRIMDMTPRYPEGDDQANNAMVRWINEKLNIEIKIAWAVEETEFANKLSLCLASNDLPDMIPMRSQEYLIFRSMVDNNLLADLTEAFEKCAGDYMLDTFASYANNNLSPFEVDGKLFAIGGGQYAYEHILTWVRADWLDEVGLKMPKTTDDIAEIVLAFQEKKPGGQDVVGIPVSYNYPVQKYNGSFDLSAVLYSTGGTPKQWVRDDDDQIIYGSILPGMKDGLAILADWYQRGIIDKQFVTRTAAGTVEALVAGGQAGLWFAPWWTGYQVNDLSVNEPDAKLACASAPVTSDGKYRHSWPGPAGDYVAMAANYPNPEVLMKILNLEYDMHRGFDQEAFELWKPSLDANVGWTSAFPTQGINLEYMDAVPRSGKIAKSIVDTGVLGAGLQGTEDMMRWADSAKSFADTGVVEGSNWLDYICRYIGANVTMESINVPVPPVFSYSTDSMADLMPNLDKLEDEMYFSIIMGEKPVDYFDEFVTQWKAQGGDRLIAEVKSLVDG